MPGYKGKKGMYVAYTFAKNKSLGVCNLCGFQTNSPAAFKLHAKFVHGRTAEPGKHKCLVCSELFKTQKEANKHSMVHKPI